MSIIKVENLSYAYPGEGQPVLKDISFEVEENEFYSVVGPSGCGKSTLIMCLNGLIPKSLGGDLNGKIIINNKNIKELSVAELAQSVQILFQNPESQLFALNVEDEISFGLENLNLPWHEIKERVDWALDLLEIKDLKHHSPEELSSGQKQKVALAAVLAMKPNVLLLDEPTANLDPRAVNHFFDIIKKLKKYLTVILVEHNIELVERFSDRILLMDNGKVVKIAKPEQMFKDKKYLNIMNPPIDLKKIKEQIKNKKPKDRLRTILEVKDVSFSYLNKFKALMDINLKIKQGDFLGIIGLNGSGKSTLALNLIGLLKPNKGDILYNEESILKKDVADISKNIGYVFQDPNYQLFEEDIFKEVAFGVKNLGIEEKEVEERVNNALKAMNLLDLKDKDPHSLSVGQKRRVTIASVLAMKPEVIIIDEPDTGLDSKTREGVMNLIVKLNKFGHTIIMISHNLELVARYCDRIIAMGNGKIAEDLDKFYEYYL